MTKKYKAPRPAFILFLIFLCGCISPLSAQSSKWVIAAQKFIPDYSIASDPVNDKTAELIPADILEKIGYSATRNIYPDEQLERSKYKLRTERQSLFLQLSAEYKKRDSLVLSNYSDMKLKSALKEADKNIKDIQKKIEENLAEVKKAEEENEIKMAQLAQELEKSDNEETELLRFKNLFKNIFVKDESLIQQEQIAFYKDDYTALYSLPEAQKELSIADSNCEKNIVSAGINCLITGHFSKYGDYISVFVDVYTFPGANKIGSVAEVGSVQDLELINTSLVMQLIPLLSNSLPVELEIVIEPVVFHGKSHDHKVPGISFNYIADAADLEGEGGLFVIVAVVGGIPGKIGSVGRGYREVGVVSSFQEDQLEIWRVALQQLFP